MKKISVTYEVGGFIYVDDDVTADEVYELLEQDEREILDHPDFDVVHREYEVSYYND